MNQHLTIRPLQAHDYQDWRPLWDGYNAFYGRAGETALPESISQQTWARFFDDKEPVKALLAERDGCVVGLVHLVIHRSTTRLADVCYLQDLFTAPQARGQGVARALIEAVYRLAAHDGCNRVYWHTHESNQIARGLYDQLANNQGYLVYVHELPA